MKSQKDEQRSNDRINEEIEQSRKEDEWMTNKWAGGWGWVDGQMSEKVALNKQ